MIEALRSGNIELVREALALDPRCARQPRVVCMAAGRAFLDAVKLLHANGADLNCLYKGYRPLHALIQEVPNPNAAHLECFEWMLRHGGADPELGAAWPTARALLIAAMAGSRAYFDSLVAFDAKVDGFVLAALGDLPGVSLELPAIATARDPHGLTALICAAGSKLPEIDTFPVVKLLLDNGADPALEVKSWNHFADAARFAAAAGNARVFRLLLERGAEANRALVSALWNSSTELGEIALEHGADPDFSMVDEQPLLNNLIRWGQFKQSFWLLERGASPNIRDGRGWTSAHQAASRGNEKMMRAVLDAGADLRVRGEGGTPVEIAQSARKFKLVEMMERRG